MMKMGNRKSYQPESLGQCYGVDEYAQWRSFGADEGVLLQE